MIYFIIAAIIVLVDQLSKYFLTLKLSGGSDVELIPGIIRLTYEQNTGAAFSFLSNMRWLLVGISSVVIIVIIIGLIRYRKKINWVGKLGLASILGGALANLFDRAVFGYVSDFFEFEFVRFAVFNVADIFITCGGVLFCIYYLLSGSKSGDLREEFMLGRGKKRTTTPKTPVGPSDGHGDSDKPEDSSGTDQT